MHFAPSKSQFALAEAMDAGIKTQPDGTVLRLFRRSGGEVCAHAAKANREALPQGQAAKPFQSLNHLQVFRKKYLHSLRFR